MRTDLKIRVEELIPTLSNASLKVPELVSMAPVFSVSKGEVHWRKLRASTAARKSEAARLRAIIKILEGSGDLMDALAGAPELLTQTVEPSEADWKQVASILSTFDRTINEIEQNQKLVVPLVNQIVELFRPLVKVLRKTNSPEMLVAARVIKEHYDAQLDALEASRDLIIAARAFQARLMDDDDELPTVVDERDMKAYLEAAWA